MSEDETNKEIPEVIRQVCSCLNELGIDFRIRDDASAVDLGYCGSAGRFAVVIHVDNDPNVLGMYVALPIVVADQKRTQMAEAITRANDHLPFGCFEFTMSNGTLGFRAAMPIDKAAITREQTRSLLMHTLLTVDHYYPAFNRLLYGDDISPAEAIAEVEMAERV